MRVAAAFLVVLVGHARAEHAVDLDSLDPPREPSAYRQWLAAQPKPVRAAIAGYCAVGYEPDPLCNGIGTYALAEPPPRQDATAHAAWEASMSPAQRRYVARACAGPRHLRSTLCGYELPAGPAEAQTYVAWRRALSAIDRAIVDEYCADMTVGTDEHCDGIGPLHIPIPPLANGQREWDAWYRGLTRAQRAYYKRYCEDEPNVSQLCGGTPLVVVFDGDVTYAHARDRDRFAIDGTTPLRTDWPTSRTPWLARDLDGDGAITSGRELFGTGTVLPDGRTAKDGFEALAALDDNHDGILDAHDLAWSQLLLWADRDGDRRGSADELVPVATAMTRISLDANATRHCDERANCERLRAPASTRDGAPAAVVDVQLPVQPPYEQP